MSLEELTDRAQITDTLHAYCDFVDTRQVDRLVDLFTEDTLVDMGKDALFRGRAELRSLLLDRIGLWTHTNHHCSTVRFVDYDGQSAHTISYVYVYHERPETDRRMQLWGRYLDQLTKTSDAWRIKERRLRVAGVSYGPSEPFPDRFERLPRASMPTRSQGDDDLAS